MAEGRLSRSCVGFQPQQRLTLFTALWHLLPTALHLFHFGVREHSVQRVSAPRFWPPLPPRAVLTHVSSN